MTNEDLINHWMVSANEDFMTMEHLFEKEDYSWSLFLGHIVIEKLLKAYFVKSKGESPPFIHGLLRLAQLTDLRLTEERKKELDIITAFNINARYDDYKKEFRKMCTREFTLKHINTIKRMKRWIEQQLLG